MSLWEEKFGGEKNSDCKFFARNIRVFFFKTEFLFLLQPNILQCIFILEQPFPFCLLIQTRSNYNRASYKQIKFYLEMCFIFMVPL